MKSCAIHQPNFFPWLPYFDKISKVDVFIFLDAVQYPKSSKSMGSWCNRVKIHLNNQDVWFSCPVVRESGPQVINRVLINTQNFDIQKSQHALRCAYVKSIGYPAMSELVERIFEKGEMISLADFNISVIKEISRKLGLNTEFIRQSELLDRGLASNEMLADLCIQVGATKYLSGAGATAYMLNDVFEGRGVDVIYQDITRFAEDGGFSILHHLATNEQSKWGVLC